MTSLSEVKALCLSLERAAGLLGEEDVLGLLIHNQMTASVWIKSSPLLVWPMVNLTGQDAEKFMQDEQRVETYRGQSFPIKNGLLVPCREDAKLWGGEVLDLPLSTGTRNFLKRLRDNPIPAGKRLRLPRGTLVQIPDTGQYYVTMDILDAPDVFCEIVIRTAVIQEFERQLKALETETQALPAVAAPASKPPKPSRTWWSVASSYMVDVMRAGQYADAKQLFNELEKTAGPDSPFDKGEGPQRGSLFVREIEKPLALKTLQNNWPKLKEAAKK